MTITASVKSVSLKSALPCLVLATFALAGCEGGNKAAKVQEEAGPMQSTALSVDKGSIDHANIQLDLKAGELKIGSGSSKLLDGHFDFNVSGYKPTMTSKVDGSHAAITITQPRDGAFGKDARNTWDLQLNNQAVMDLTLHCGAGKADLDLGSLNLRSVQVSMGAGEVNMDLSGHPQHDYDVEMQGGVGQATIHLPKGVGIRADVHGGLGSIDVTGLEKKDDHYENESFDNAKVNVRLKISGGIGQIRIVD